MMWLVPCRAFINNRGFSPVIRGREKTGKPFKRFRVNLAALHTALKHGVNEMMRSCYPVVNDWAREKPHIEIRDTHAAYRLLLTAYYKLICVE
jgi:type VI protein secretion system component VasA